MRKIEDDDCGVLSPWESRNLQMATALGLSVHDQAQLDMPKRLVHRFGRHHSHTLSAAWLSRNSASGIWNARFPDHRASIQQMTGLNRCTDGLLLRMAVSWDFITTTLSRPSM